MSNDRKPVYYKVDEPGGLLSARDISEAVEEYVDQIWGAEEIPEEVKVHGFAQRQLNADADHLARVVTELVLERLDENYAHVEMGYTEETPTMLEAAKTFVDAVLDEYEPTIYDVVSTETVRVRDYVKLDPA